MRQENDTMCAAYKGRIDNKENRSAIRKALTAMDFEQMIDFVLFSAQSGFKDGVEAVLKEMEEQG